MFGCARQFNNTSWYLHFLTSFSSYSPFYFYIFERRFYIVWLSKTIINVSNKSWFRNDFVFHHVNDLQFFSRCALPTRPQVASNVSPSWDGQAYLLHGGLWPGSRSRLLQTSYIPMWTSYSAPGIFLSIQQYICGTFWLAKVHSLSSCFHKIRNAFVWNQNNICKFSSRLAVGLITYMFWKPITSKLNNSMFFRLQQIKCWCLQYV